MAERAKGPRGVPDLVPPASELLTEVEDVARSLFERYGYRRIETPLFESTDVFQRAAGDASDIVLDKQMFTFADRRDRSYSLRPEATAGIARAYTEQNLGDKLAPPVRLSLMGWMFRYERPQKGRTRQFHQIDAEVIGSAEAIIDAELIALASEFFVAIGLDPELQLNSMGHPDDREAYFPVLKEAIGDKVDDMCKDCHVRLEKNPLRVFDCKVPTCKRILRGDVPPITEFLCEDCRNHFASVQQILETLGIPWKNDPYLVRGLDYYTRTVFEFVLEGFGARGTVCAGGRYDGLIETLGGKSTPAVGFAIGSEPVLVALREARGEPEATTPDVFVVWMEGLASIAMATALDLRKAGLRVLVADEPKSMKAALRAADRSGAPRAVILGAEEIAKGVATVKALATGDQREIALDALVKEFTS
jgi:histidyl-tRNA synthetase